MSQDITISITDRATPAMRKIIAATTPRALGEIIWPEALDATQRKLTSYKNKRNFPSQRFGEQLAEKTFGTATDAGAQIVIHGQGARQLLYGGPIKPLPGKKVLCFAIASESYGKTLPEMFGGRIPPRENRTAADRAKLKQLRPLFAFAPEVNQPAHPGLIPSANDYRDLAVKAVKKAVKGGFHA